MQFNAPMQKISCGTLVFLLRDLLQQTKNHLAAVKYYTYNPAVKPKP